MVEGVDRERALAELTAEHAVALRLRDAGAAQMQIAVALGIPVEGVATLLTVAEAKLAAIWAEQSQSGVEDQTRSSAGRGAEGVADGGGYADDPCQE